MLDIKALRQNPQQMAELLARKRFAFELRQP